MNFMTSIQLGMSSSQLTFIFFRGVGIPPTSVKQFGRNWEKRENLENEKSILLNM
jgi:AraC-like DNA-binding protein